MLYLPHEDDGVCTRLIECMLYAWCVCMYIHSQTYACIYIHIYIHTFDLPQENDGVCTRLIKSMLYGWRLVARDNFG